MAQSFNDYLKDREAKGEKFYHPEEQKPTETPVRDETTIVNNSLSSKENNFSFEQFAQIIIVFVSIALFLKLLAFLIKNKSEYYSKDTFSTAEVIRRLFFLSDFGIIIFFGGVSVVETIESPSNALKYILIFGILYLPFCLLVWILSPILGKSQISYRPILLKIIKS